MSLSYNLMRALAWRRSIAGSSSLPNVFNASVCTSCLSRTEKKKPGEMRERWGAPDRAREKMRCATRRFVVAREAARDHSVGAMRERRRFKLAQRL